MVSSMMSGCVLFGFGIGPMEMLIVGAIGVLLFGKRLPEIARSMGASVVEFKRGMNGIQNDINSSVYSSSTPARGSLRSAAQDDYEEASAPKFEPPQSEPQSEPVSGAKEA